MFRDDRIAAVHAVALDGRECKMRALVRPQIQVLIMFPDFRPPALEPHIYVTHVLGTPLAAL
ncbi:hypothetical protein PISMIDRAFT_681383 [Pisolithus microcarpus 441]|uniref:Unplaced genomic scaffold scaffold_68, whole genome shotgun sequence n=1 Tax=Pisolithus microcarpus 441 TaxID=765257 RepID=A0A0C9Y9Q9_9AGAM|nr:hypothetical protein PISMIDRAFT_681383 [Pisolithus microcarpus 441]